MDLVLALAEDLLIDFVWTDELLFDQWRIQRNVYTGNYRLLDESDVRQAWGTLAENAVVRDALAGVLEQIQIIAEFSIG